MHSFKLDKKHKSPAHLNLLRHQGRNRAPEIASVPSSSLPRISIDKSEIVPESRTLVLGSIDTSHDLGAEFGSSSLVEVDLIRCVVGESGPGRDGV